MADARLRELARWDQVDLKTQVRLLRERMRAGELSEDRVRLAAWLGDACSVTIAGDEARGPDDFSSWAEGRPLRDLPLRVGVLTGLLFAEPVLREWASRPDDVRHWGPCSPGEQVRRVEAWLGSPGEEEARRVERAFSRLGQVGQYDGPPFASWQAAHDYGWHLCGLVAGVGDLADVLCVVAGALELAGRGLVEGRPEPERERAAELRVRTAVREPAP